MGNVMKLSEQIQQTCCGVLADRQEMIDKAARLEAQVECMQEYIEELQFGIKVLNEEIRS